jgi:AmmeMemoRadiSam system protein A
MINKISEKAGKFLLKFARETIAKELTKSQDTVISSPSEQLKAELKENRGVFVTLNKNHQLRGCIGNIEPIKSILEGVSDNAKNAAFHDPRFRPLSKDELDSVCIEVSILTKPETLKYDDDADLIKKIRPGIDGLIIKKQYYGATFLPQVWDQLPSPESFLSHLCAKAGLSPDEWKKGSLEVRTYQVQFFEE